MHVACQLELRTQHGQEVLPLEGERVNIGRSALNHIVLAGDENVSRQHAVLLAGISGWIIRDRSRNGTFVNGERVRDERLLCDGDEVTVGSTRLMFRIRVAESLEEATATTTLDPSVVLTLQPRDPLEQTRHDTGFNAAGRAAVSTSAQVADNSTARNVFRREGEFWSLGFAGRLVRLKDSKGLRDIASLLGAPGTEIAAVDLVGTSGVRASQRAVTLAQDGFGIEAGVGPILDAHARQQYLGRLRELDEELAESTANNDPVRKSLIGDEREFLLTELREAIGLGGRLRRSNDPTERARKAISMRIRGAINRIEDSHIDLARHLRVSVRTGAFCVYDPAERTRWELDDGRATSGDVRH